MTVDKGKVETLPVNNNINLSLDSSSLRRSLQRLPPRQTVASDSLKFRPRRQAPKGRAMYSSRGTDMPSMRKVASSLDPQCMLELVGCNMEQSINPNSVRNRPTNSTRRIWKASKCTVFPNNRPRKVHRMRKCHHISKTPTDRNRRTMHPVPQARLQRVYLEEAYLPSMSQ